MGKRIGKGIKRNSQLNLNRQLVEHIISTENWAGTIAHLER